MTIPAPTDLTFILRTAGERTAHASAAELKRQLGPDADRLVTVIHERPFSAAVRRTLEIGLDARRPFTIGLDADVLLASDGVARLCSLCAAMTPGTYSLAGLTLCRFSGGYCFRGVHLYRTELLEQALPLVGVHTPGGADPDLKPETAVVNAMQARGHGFGALPVPLGIHDYEQLYRHIYLKMRLRARRQLEIDTGENDAAPFREHCRLHAERGDHDFTVALWGLDDGTADSRARASSSPAPANYDWYAPQPELDARLLAAGLAEKPGLDTDTHTLADRLMAAHDTATDGRSPEWIRRALTGLPARAA
jgi:hypothetical protein